VLVVGTGPLANLIGGLITTSNHSHVLAGYVGCPRDSVVVPNEHIVDGGGIDISETARREHAENRHINYGKAGQYPSEGFDALQIQRDRCVRCPDVL